MPNQRAADKKAVSTWIPNDLKNTLVRIAEERDLTLAAYVQGLYEDAAAKYVKKAGKNSAKARPASGGSAKVKPAKKAGSGKEKGKGKKK
jgi:hypothetical protein